MCLPRSLIFSSRSLMVELALYRGMVVGSSPTGRTNFENKNGTWPDDNCDACNLARGNLVSKLRQSERIGRLTTR